MSGLFIILVGNHNPFLFALAVAPATVAISMLRPPSMNILLEQGKKDTGAASSLMNFSFTFMGSLGVLFISMDWDNRILVFGLMDLIAGMGCLVFWPRAWKRCKPSE